jgi:hypothetical protein
LTDNFSKAREKAESAFGKTQSQFLARNRTISELDAVVQTRDEKTVRLRAARKEKEASDLAAANAANPAKPGGKTR